MGSGHRPATGYVGHFHRGRNRSNYTCYYRAVLFNYSATNDKKKKKKEEGWRNKKWFKGKNGKERGGRKRERKKGILIAGRTEKNVANCR